MTDLTAYYDLDIAPPTYDAVSFIQTAEMERLKVGAEGIDFRIIPGSNEGFRKGPLWPKDTESRLKMKERVLLPLFHLLPSMRSVVEVERREEGGFGVRNAMYGFKFQMQAYKANIRPLRSPFEDVTDRSLATITLRESEHWPTRNSDVPVWLEAADRLKAEGYRVIFIRDTLRAHELLPGHETNIIASIGVLARARLYARAGINLFVNNGPAWLAVAMNLPVAIFRLLDDECPACRRQAFTAAGFPYGASYLPEAPHQQISWKPETVDAILRAVKNAR